MPGAMRFPPIYRIVVLAALWTPLVGCQDMPAPFWAKTAKPGPTTVPSAVSVVQAAGVAFSMLVIAFGIFLYSHK